MARRSRERGATPALEALGRAAVEFTVHPYEHDPGGELSYGLEAASALGVDPERVFKTLVADVDGGLVVAVVPVPGRLDLKALARACGGRRAVLAEQARAERSTGYVVGGISPLGQRQPLPTVVDGSAERHSTVFVSGGRRGLDVEISPVDLVALTGARTAAIGRG